MSRLGIISPAAQTADTEPGNRLEALTLGNWNLDHDRIEAEGRRIEQEREARREVERLAREAAETRANRERRLQFWRQPTPQHILDDQGRTRAEEEALQQRNIREEEARPTEWNHVAPGLRARFPDANIDSLRDHFNELARHEEVGQQMRAAESRARGSSDVNPSDLGRLGTELAQRTLPFVSTGMNIVQHNRYVAARERVSQGTATREDYDYVAAHQERQHLGTRAAEEHPFLSDATQVGPMLGEAYVGGAIARPLLGAVGLGGSAAAGAGIARGAMQPTVGQAAMLGLRAGAVGAGRTAATTAATLPFMPSMYVPGAIQNAEQHGGDFYAWQNMAPAVAVGAINTAILGQMAGGVGHGQSTAGAVGRFVGKVALGMGEQQLADIGIGLIGAASGNPRFSQEYGLAGQFLNGDQGHAWQHLAAQALTFTIFGLVHVAQDTTPAERRPQEASQLTAFDRGQGPYKGMVPNPLDVLTKTLVPEMTRRGMTPEQQQKQIEVIHELFKKALEKNPNLTRDEAIDLVSRTPIENYDPRHKLGMASMENPFREYALAIADTFPAVVPEQRASAQTGAKPEPLPPEQPTPATEPVKPPVDATTPRVDAPITPEQATESLNKEQSRIDAEGRNARSGTTQPEAKPEVAPASPEAGTGQETVVPGEPAKSSGNKVPQSIEVFNEVLKHFMKKEGFGGISEMTYRHGKISAEIKKVMVEADKQLTVQEAIAEVELNRELAKSEKAGKEKPKMDADKVKDVFKNFEGDTTTPAPAKPAELEAKTPEPAKPEAALPVEASPPAPEKPAPKLGLKETKTEAELKAEYDKKLEDAGLGSTKQGYPKRGKHMGDLEVPEKHQQQIEAANLSEEHRTAIEGLLSGNSLQTLADKLGVTKPTIANRARKAFEKMKKADPTGLMEYDTYQDLLADIRLGQGEAMLEKGTTFTESEGSNVKEGTQGKTGEAKGTGVLDELIQAMEEDVTHHEQQVEETHAEIERRKSERQRTTDEALSESLKVAENQKGSSEVDRPTEQVAEPQAKDQAAGAPDRGPGREAVGAGEPGAQAAEAGKPGMNTGPAVASKPAPKPRSLSKTPAAELTRPEIKALANDLAGAVHVSPEQQASLERVNKNKGTEKDFENLKEIIRAYRREFGSGVDATGWTKEKPAEPAKAAEPESFRSKAERWEKEADDVIKNNDIAFSNPLHPTLIAALVKKVASKIILTGYKFADWVAAAKANANIGDGPHVQDIWDQAEALVDKTVDEGQPVAHPWETPKGMGKFIDDIKRLLSPASRSGQSEQASGTLRENLAELARKTDVARESLKEYKATLDAMPETDRLALIDSIETGTPTADPQHQPIADALRQILDQRRQQVQDLGTGKLEQFIDNYFPHIWKDPVKAEQAFSEGGKRPLEGSKGFLKKREIPTTKEGIAAGLVPVSTNPVELALLKIQEMDRYVMAHKSFNEWKESGLVKFVRLGARAPEGWVPFNDKMSKVFAPPMEGGAGPQLVGNYYMPEPAALLVNNYLSPGFRGNMAFDAFRGLGNMMNQFQLGLSAFHAGLVFLDTQVSAASLGLQQISRGEVMKGLKNLILSPLAPFFTWIEGGKVSREYYSPGSEGAEIAGIVGALVKGGGRAKMDDFYGGTHIDAFKEAYREVRSGNLKSAGGLLWHALPALSEALSYPIMEVLVPRMKLGVFAEMARSEMERNPSMTTEQARETFGKAWDSVENRLGQMTYDNLFWNKMLKDSLMAGVRSVGWNVGTWRELGGGIKDIPSSIIGIKEGEGISPRLGYVIALPMITAFYGSIYQYLATGEGPSELKDLFFPKTGRTRKDGVADRIAIPSYMRDVQTLTNRGSEGPLRIGQNLYGMARSKANPAVITVAEMLSNEDFHHTAIRDPQNPATRQAYDTAMHFLRSFESFSVRAVREQREQNGPMSQSVGAFFGLSPANSSVVHSTEQQQAIERSHHVEMTPLERLRRSRGEVGIRSGVPHPPAPGRPPRLGLRRP